MKIDKNNSDEELVRLIQETEASAYLSLLLDRHRSYVVKKCSSYTDSRIEAEDLAQEILIKIFLKLRGFRKEARFKTWLNSIIINTCLDFLRKRSKKIQIETITDKLIDSVPEDFELDLEDDSEHARNAMLALLESISHEDKLLLMLKYKEKHTVREIQLTLGLSESAVKMRLSRARSKLQQLYRQMSKES